MKVTPQADHRLTKTFMSSGRGKMEMFIGKELYIDAIVSLKPKVQNRHSSVDIHLT